MWWALLPMRIAGAKSRLASPLGATLATAFAQDVVSALAECTAVEGLVVVSDAPVQLSAPNLPVIEVADTGGGLNAALRMAAAAIPVGRGAAAIVADLPAVKAGELHRAFAAATDHARSFVCDAEGIGTCLLLARDPARLEPLFGERSRARHAASGAVELDPEGVPGLRRDVDTEICLWDAVRLGVGPATRAALR